MKVNAKQTILGTITKRKKNSENKIMPVWECKRCKKRKQVNWFEMSAFRKSGEYVCFQCKDYEQTLLRINNDLQRLLKNEIDKVVEKSIKKLISKVNKLQGE